MTDNKQPLKKPNNRAALKSNATGLICVFLFMAAAAMMINGRIFGYQPSLPGDTPNPSTISSGDTTIINTTTTGKDIIGYAGPVPLEIRMVDGHIDSITPLPNSETPGFFKRVINAQLLQKWQGMTPAEALETKVDAVSGATYSSQAIIHGVQAAMKPLADKAVEQPSDDKSDPWTAETISILIVIAMAMTIPLFVKSKPYRIAQQILNTAVLGFWGGTFIDYTLLLNIFSNKPSAWMSLTTLMLIIVAFIYPLFRRKGHYCAWVCPLGSLQELAADCNPKHHIKLSAKTINALTTLRTIIWALLMLALWTAMFVSWIDYELFTAFIIKSASTSILIAGALILAISFFIPRPYCRFICPTGTLLRYSQNIENK